MTDLIRSRYEPLERLGRGGQGDVLRALDRVHRRHVALKVRECGSDEREALFREARILFAVRPHPSLPVVREDFVEDGRYYLVMDWIDGRNLRQVLHDEGTPGLPLERVLDYLGQAAEAIDHLHDHDPQVVHRDVKPSNLVLTPDGRVVLVDFGIAARGAGSSSGTSRDYAPPELVAGEAMPASDVYSLAATGYALLTGSPPRPEVKPRIQNVPAAVGDAVLRAFRRALATDPARRPASAGALVESVRAAAGASAAGSRRVRRWVLASALVVLGGIGVAVWLRPSSPAASTFVRVGENPTSVVANPQTRVLYVANAGSKSISVIDGRANRVVATVDVGSRPEGIAVIPRNGRVYVANAESSVSVIDGTANRVVETIRLTGRPVGIAVNPRLNRIYVATSDGMISVISADSNAIVSSIRLTGSPTGIAASPETGRVYVTDERAGMLSVIDGASDRVTATVPVSARPCGVAVNHKRNSVYVAVHDSGTVAVVDGTTNRVVKTVTVGPNPCGVAVNAQTNRVYVMGDDGGTLSVIDGVANTVIRTRALLEGRSPTGLLPYEVAVDPQTKLVYVVDQVAGGIRILDESAL